jgi:hypothetical protein
MKLNCPRCHHKIFKSDGSWLSFIVLLLLGIIPGIIYATWALGIWARCPRCGLVLPGGPDE